MTNRSRLQVRSHVDLARRGEFIFAVLRDGEVVATIFGSREGLHIVSERLADSSRNKPFFFQVGDLPPGYVIPLLQEGEECPWCKGAGVIAAGESPRPCPVCSVGQWIPWPPLAGALRFSPSSVLWGCKTAPRSIRASSGLPSVARTSRPISRGGPPGVRGDGELSSVPGPSLWSMPWARDPGESARPRK